MATSVNWFISPFVFAAGISATLLLQASPGDLIVSQAKPEVEITAEQFLSCGQLAVTVGAWDGQPGDLISFSCFERENGGGLKATAVGKEAKSPQNLTGPVKIIGVAE